MIKILQYNLFRYILKLKYYSLIKLKTSVVRAISKQFRRKERRARATRPPGRHIRTPARGYGNGLS